MIVTKYKAAGQGITATKFIQAPEDDAANMILPFAYTKYIAQPSHQLLKVSIASCVYQPHPIEWHIGLSIAIYFVSL